MGHDSRHLDLCALSCDLFWDVPRESVDPTVHGRWLVERVIERGRWEDWLHVSESLGVEELERLAPGLRISEKSRKFLGVWIEMHAAR